jgi:hypothetical protein
MLRHSGHSDCSTSDACAFSRNCYAGYLYSNIGRVYGGHVGYGSRVRTTAEVLVAPLPNWSLTREHDATTGFTELLVRRRM